MLRGCCTATVQQIVIQTAAEADVKFALPLAWLSLFCYDGMLGLVDDLLCWHAVQHQIQSGRYRGSCFDSCWCRHAFSCHAACAVMSMRSASLLMLAGRA